MKGRCELCEFWSYYGGDDDVGDCQRYPPQVVWTNGFLADATTEWPKTKKYNRCGEFKEKVK